MTDTQTKMTTTLTHEDVQDLLKSFAAAIELDQIRVDALAPWKFHPIYNDSMWRRCRRDHLDLVNQLLRTVDTMQPTLLQELTRLAITYQTTVVCEAIANLFAEAANGMRPTEEFETAALFFGCLIKDVSGRPAGRPLNGDPKALIMRWFTVNDPLRIAEDPECSYGAPVGFVS